MVFLHSDKYANNSTVNQQDCTKQILVKIRVKLCDVNRSHLRAIICHVCLIPHRTDSMHAAGWPGADAMDSGRPLMNDTDRLPPYAASRSRTPSVCGAGDIHSPVSAAAPSGFADIGVANGTGRPNSSLGRLSRNGSLNRSSVASMVPRRHSAVIDEEDVDTPAICGGHYSNGPYFGHNPSAAYRPSTVERSASSKNPRGSRRSTNSEADTTRSSMAMSDLATVI